MDNTLGLKQSKDERSYKSLNNLMPKEYLLMVKNPGVSQNTLK